MAGARKKLFVRILRWIVRLTLAAFFLMGLVLMLPQENPDGFLPQETRPVSELSLEPGDRILLLSPHPDDDVLACAGILQKAVGMGLPVRVAFLTNGDANEWSFVTYSHRVPVDPRDILKMGDVRHNEAIAGEAVLGVPQERITFLGYPDHGTLDMFTSHWGAAPPLKSLLTRVTAVPYQYALSPSAPYKGESVLSDLQKMIGDFKPTRIFVSHPVDLNVDHRALYLYTRVALWHMPSLAPRLHPFLVHSPRWPHPEGLHEDESLTPPGPFRGQIDWLREKLSRLEVTHKASAIGAHQTQMSYSASYLLSFVRREELFGTLDTVDLRPGAPQGEQLVSNETAPLAGEEWRYARVKEDRLEVSLVYSRPIARSTRAVFYLFGDRVDRPFDQMPKLSVTVDPFHLSVYDQGVKLKSRGVRVSRVARRTTVSVPLRELGDPQHVLMAAESVLGEVKLDFGWWTTIEVRP